MAGLRGPPSKGKWMGGRGKRAKGRRKRGKGEEKREGPAALSQIPGSAPAHEERRVHFERLK